MNKFAEGFRGALCIKTHPETWIPSPKSLCWLKCLFIVWPEFRDYEIGWEQVEKHVNWSCLFSLLQQSIYTRANADPLLSNQNNRVLNRCFLNDRRVNHQLWCPNYLLLGSNLSCETSGRKIQNQCLSFSDLSTLQRVFVVDVMATTQTRSRHHSHGVKIVLHLDVQYWRHSVLELLRRQRINKTSVSDDVGVISVIIKYYGMKKCFFYFPVVRPSGLTYVIQMLFTGVDETGPASHRTYWKTGCKVKWLQWPSVSSHIMP